MEAIVQQHKPSIVISNSPPVVTEVDLRSTTESFCTNQAVLIRPSDIVTHSYEWLVNGSGIPHGGSYLSNSFWPLVPNDTISCVATPHDGHTAGQPLQSESTQLLQPYVTLSGRTLFHDIPVGGITVLSEGLISLQTVSTIGNGNYLIETPTVSEGIIRLNLQHTTVPDVFEMGQANELLILLLSNPYFQFNPITWNKQHPNNSNPTLVNGAMRMRITLITMLASFRLI